jgi:hypothetical protein
MFVAAVSVHVKQGFFITTGGYEYTFVLGVAGLTVAFTDLVAIRRTDDPGLDLSSPRPPVAEPAPAQKRQ